MTRALAPVRAMLAKATRAESRDYVTADEIRKARDLAKSPARELLGVLWVTGARISEALAIRRKDLDTHLQTVKLQTLKKRTPTVRSQPIPGEYFAELLGLVLAQDNAIWNKGGGDRGAGAEARIFSWSRSRAFEVVRAALLAAGVGRDRARPHAIRHGHAIYALQNGVPLNVLQRTMGHASIVTTSIYLSITAEDVRREYKRINW